MPHAAPNVAQALKKLSIAAFAPLAQDGFVVGGALRDYLLGKSFNDIDWVVSQPKEQAQRAAQALGGRAFIMDAARNHWRCVAMSAEGLIVRDYAPLQGDINDNLLARDYTINALALGLDSQLIDPSGGVQDLMAQSLRLTQAPNLLADPLRALRAVRLSLKLNFSIEEATQKAIRQLDARHIMQPSAERIFEELKQIMMQANAARGIMQLLELGLLEHYLPELAACDSVAQGGFHHLDVFRHSVEALAQLCQAFPEADVALRFATLLHDIGKPSCKSYDDTGHYYHFYGHDKVGADLAQARLKALKSSNDISDKVSALVRYHMLPLPKNDKEAKRFVHKRQNLLPDLLKLMIADREAAKGPLSSEASRINYRIAVSRVLAVLDAPQADAPLLTGHEVIALLNLKPSRYIGEAISFLQEAQAVGDVRNRQEAEAALLHFAKHQGWIEE